MKISVIAPVKNEAQFIGYSIMSCIDFVHEFVYALDPTSDDGTLEILTDIYKTHPQGSKVRYIVKDEYAFDPLDMKAYNDAYNDCIARSSGDAVWFLHPDMIVTNPEAIARIPEWPYAWFTHLTSFANNLNTVIVSGRSKRWKNIYTKSFGLHYYGAYGSQNEDFYFRDITGTSYRHYGEDFDRYPYLVADSGIYVNHYCEVKPFERRLAKMKSCLATLYPQVSPDKIEEMALSHPRVTLDTDNKHFGDFKLEPDNRPIPEVFKKYSWQKRLSLVS